MRNFIVFLILFLSFNIQGQKIRIINVTEYSINNQKQYKILCELINNSKSSKLVLPIPVEDIKDGNRNVYNESFQIETNPKNAIISEDYPPIVFTKTNKLIPENTVTCEPNSSTRFEIDTKNLTHGAHYFDKNIKIKKIRLIYNLYGDDAKETYLSNELIDTEFYTNKIKSNFFKI